MIPDWIEYSFKATELVSTIGGLGLAYTKLVLKLGKRIGALEAELSAKAEALKAELAAKTARDEEHARKMLVGLDYNNQVTESAAKKGGSDPPPRPRLVTQPDDPFSVVMEEYRKRTDPDELTPTDPSTPASKRWKTGG
jgi:hypothetical protein